LFRIGWSFWNRGGGVVAKNSRSASTERSTSKATAKSTTARASKSTSKSTTSKSAASKSVTSKSAASKSTPSKSTPSKSATSKSASKAPVKGASKSITRSARTGRSAKTTAPTALAGGTTRTSRRAPLTTVTENPTTRVRARSAVTGRPVNVKQPQIRQVKVRTPQVREVDIAHVDLEGVEVSEVSVLESVIATVRGAAPQLRVDTFGPVDRTEIHLLDELVTDSEEITVVGKDNRRLSVAGAVLKALATVLSALDRGATVTVTEADELDTELTSQEAADLLNVSRPYVVKLAREGVLPHHRVGNRHRFTLTDVLEHRARMRAATEEALAELAPADGYTAADF
jgi:excisionase family DNA binding protein